MARLNSRCVMDQVLYKKMMLLILMRETLRLCCVQFEQDVYDALLSDVVQMHGKTIDESFSIGDRSS